MTKLAVWIIGLALTVIASCSGVEPLEWEFDGSRSCDLPDICYRDTDEDDRCESVDRGSYAYLCTGAPSSMALCCTYKNTLVRNPPQNVYCCGASIGAGG